MIVKATPSIILASFLVGLIAGVALSSWLTGTYLFLAAIVVLDAAMLVVRRAPWRDRLLLLGLLAVGLVAGIWRYSLVGPGPTSVAHTVGEERSIEATIVKHEGDVGSQKLTLSDLVVDDAATKDRLLIFTSGYPVLTTGDRVRFSCAPEAPEPFDGFKYDRYLATKDIYATCYIRQVPEVVGEGERFVAIDRLHDSVLKVIDRTFGEPQSSLLAGLLMGDDRFTEAWKDHFLRTGTSHVVAASGYNVSVVSVVLFAILIAVGFRRQQAFPLVLLGIATFVILAGAEAAVTRAGIMGALALSATQLGRKTTPRNIILLTVVLMLLDEPRLLRDDIGFQLSVLSTTGLITMAKYFTEKFSFVPETLGLRESFASTIAATLATLPIIIFGFGRFSIISPFVNLLVLPFIPYAMLTGAAAIVVGAIDQSLGALVAGPAWLFLTAMLEIIQAMASLPFAIIEL